MIYCGCPLQGCQLWFYIWQGNFTLLQNKWGNLRVSVCISLFYDDASAIQATANETHALAASVNIINLVNTLLFLL
jgi:hypothetical protein